VTESSTAPDDPRVPASYADAIRDLFRDHGYDGVLLVVDDLDPTEATFLVPDGALLTIREPALSAALQALLGRKVWVIEASPRWTKQARPFP
jgi:hypothetical protein